MATLEQNQQYGRASLYTWNLTQADGTGDAGISPGAADRTVQVYGNFDAGSIIIEGSNDPAKAEWSTLHDHAGIELTLTVETIAVILENPLFIRPRFTGGGGSGNLFVRMLSRSN